MSYIADRRPSMAERRPSLTPTSASIIPHLAGLEKPLNSQPVIEKCDVLVIGTGLIESVVAAALSWQGSNVLHIDAKNYYGDADSTLTIDQLKHWCHQVNNHQQGYELYEKALMYIPSDHQRQIVSKNYGIDLNPKIMFARSDLLSLLIKSKVFKYLEFSSLSNFHVFENDSFEKISNTKEDIFTDQSLSLVTKRNLMKLLKFVLQDNEDPTKLEILNANVNTPIDEFLTTKFNLLRPQINELIFSIGLCNSSKVRTPEALARIKRFLVSFDVYGNFPVLYSKYGGPGEVSQGFCRSAAVAGTTYKLNNQLVSYDAKSKVASFNDGSHVKVEEKIICSTSQLPSFIKHANPEILQHEKSFQISRLVTIVKKDCKEWLGETESSCVVVFPPESLPCSNKQAVQVLIQGSGAGVCPSGQCIWYFSTIEPGELGRKDLESALSKMEESIMRESTDEFQVEVDANDVIFKNGTPIISSVKLGKSFKDFVPKEKLQYLMKLMFTQYTAIPPLGLMTSKKLDHTILSKGDFIFTNMPSSEISYDGIITESKLIYSKVTGTDEDFFDVDFEDDDEEYHQQSTNNADIADNDHEMASDTFGAEEMEL